MGRRLGSRTVRTSEDRLANYQAMVDRRGDDECWPWLGTTNKHGYGRFYDGSRYRSAASYGHEALVGPVPAGEEINHSCGTNGCQNPSHWFTDTHAMNMAEMRERTRST